MESLDVVNVLWNDHYGTRAARLNMTQDFNRIVWLKAALSIAKNT